MNKRYKLADLIGFLADELGNEFEADSLENAVERYLAEKGELASKDVQK